MKREKIKRIALLLCVILAISFAGCGKKVEQPEPTTPETRYDLEISSTTTVFTTSTTVTTITTTKEPLTAEKAAAIWENFLVSGEYQSYTKDADAAALEYVITDLNADTIPELLIQSRTDAPFYTTWTFVLDSRDIVLANETYGYGSFRYAPNEKAVIGSPEWKPFSGTGYSPFYRLQGTEWVFLFEIGQDEGKSYYRDANGKKDISDAQRSAYYADAVHFEWNPIQSLLSE